MRGGPNRRPRDHIHDDDDMDDTISYAGQRVPAETRPGAGSDGAAVSDVEVEVEDGFSHAQGSESLLRGVVGNVTDNIRVPGIVGDLAMHEVDIVHIDFVLHVDEEPNEEGVHDGEQYVKKEVLGSASKQGFFSNFEAAQLNVENKKEHGGAVPNHFSNFKTSINPSITVRTELVAKFPTEVHDHVHVGDSTNAVLIVGDKVSLLSKLLVDKGKGKLVVGTT